MNVTCCYHFLFYNNIYAHHKRYINFNNESNTFYTVNIMQKKNMFDKNECTTFLIWNLNNKNIVIV